METLVPHLAPGHSEWTDLAKDLATTCVAAQMIILHLTQPPGLLTASFLIPLRANEKYIKSDRVMK